MATSVDEARIRIRAQRALIEQKVEDLESQAASDLTHLQERTAHHATHTVNLLPGGTAAVEAMRAHPLAGLMSALGAGVVLGIATDGASTHDPDDRSTAAKGHGPIQTVAEALKDPAVGLASMLGAGPFAILRPHVEGMVRDWLSPAQPTPSNSPADTRPTVGREQ